MQTDHVALALQLLREEFKYDLETLPEKGVHKLLYLVNEEAKHENLEVKIPHFWFQFGVMTPLDREADGHTSLQLSENDSDSSEKNELAPRLRPVVKRVLQQYYSTSLEDVTDHTYEDAPYEVQRAWRELDKKLRTHHPDYNDFYEVNPSRQSIQESIYYVCDAFPEARFPKFEADLNTWYSMMARELNSPEFDAVEMFDINIAFWRIFCLRLAEDHRHGLSKAEVKKILDIDSFTDAREACRRKLRNKESETLKEQFKDDTQVDSVETRAADALAEALVSKHTTSKID